MQLNIDVNSINNFPFDEKVRLRKLISIFDHYAFKNAQKNRYYEGNISLAEVNLGIALPQGLAGLEIGCAWGANTGSSRSR